jgi:hypothetical protein
MVKLKRCQKRISSSKQWTVVIDDGFVSYEFNPILNGSFNIQEVADMVQMTMDCIQEDPNLKKQLEERRENNPMES